MTETNRRRLKELLERPENEICADCDFKSPDWGSHNIGVFLCSSCAAIHRGLGAHISKIKSVKLDNWDRTQVSMMEDVGNEKANCQYEQYLPNYYRRPKQGDAPVIFEQFIRAKYERREFTKALNTAYSKGEVLEGMLMKRGKDDGKFLPRKFVLNHLEGTLKYFVKQNDKKPKAMMNLATDNVNIAFCPQKIHQNGLQITYLATGKTRSIFVYNEDPKIIIDWFTALRATKLHHMQIAFPETPPEELVEFLTRDFVMEGFLWKTGPKASDAFRKRYFVLDDRKLMYLDHPLDAYPKGEIFLGEADEGYRVEKGIPSNMKAHEYGFALYTPEVPERVWLFGALGDEDRDNWVMAIGSIINRSMVPQGYAVSLRANLRNSYSYKKRGSSSSGGSNNARSISHGSVSSFTSTLRKGKGFFSDIIHH